MELSGKRVLILGSGGTSQTVRAAAEAAGASEIRTVSRSGALNYETMYGLRDTEGPRQHYAGRDVPRQ